MKKSTVNKRLGDFQCAILLIATLLAIMGLISIFILPFVDATRTAMTVIRWEKVSIILTLSGLLLHYARKDIFHE